MTIRRLANLSLVLLQGRTFFIAVFQSLLVFASFGLAWFLRFDFSLPYRTMFFYAAVVLVVTRLLSFARFNLLHGWWQYTGVSDAANVAKVIAIGSLVFWGMMQIVPFGTGFPRSVFLLEAILSGVSLGGVRLLSRAVAESARRDRMWEKKTLLIGAGFAAEMIIRELARPGSQCRVVGCVDDDASKVGISLHGVPVLDTIAQLSKVLKSYPVDELIIAVPSATSEQMRRFVALCNATKVKYRTVPALRDLISGQLTLTQIRDVSLEDLLGREPAHIDLASVVREIAGKRVLVTGAAGSIGSELCRQILEYKPSQLACLDQSENGLFFLDRSLSPGKNGSKLSLHVGDVAEQQSMRILLSRYQPEIIFHAAAYKHVPMMEANVHEAVRNNVFGLFNLVNIADEVGCRSFIMISSDKAVNPTNVMGATKRICELILASKPPNGMRCVSVRFGNVLGSSGSVVPLFREQLEKNQPLTITDPEIRRFFMTTREAVALVLQASAIGDHGDILVLDMGEPVKILDLARSLIRLSGKSEDDVQIRFTGLRPGEKFDEELFYGSEGVLPTSCPKIKRTQAAFKDWLHLRLELDQLYSLMSGGGVLSVRRKIADIITDHACVDETPLQTDMSPEPLRSMQKAAGDD
jgi:FlaA1/EpsC-like NDP-sugar epimerase